MRRSPRSDNGAAHPSGGRASETRSETDRSKGLSTRVTESHRLRNKINMKKTTLMDRILIFTNIALALFTGVQVFENHKLIKITNLLNIDALE